MATYGDTSTMRRGPNDSHQQQASQTKGYQLSPAVLSLTLFLIAALSLSLDARTHLVGTVLGGAEHVREEDAAVVAVRDVVPRQLLVLPPQMRKRAQAGLRKSGVRAGWTLRQGLDRA